MASLAEGSGTDLGLACSALPVFTQHQGAEGLGVFVGEKMLC
jgi:hypothetical protein